MPYRYERFGLRFTPMACVIDEGVSLTPSDRERHLIDLSEERFERAAIEVEITVPNELLETVLPPQERQAPPCALVLCVRSMRTYLRRGIMLADLRANEELPFEWEEGVLRHLLPSLYPNHADHASRLARLHEDLEAEREALLLQRLDGILQRETPKHLTRLLESLE